MNTDLVIWLSAVSTFALAMSGTPGPNNTMVAASGASFGFVRTLPHMLGVIVGFPVMIVAVALGAGDLLRTAPALHQALKWIGAAYLLWLALKIAAARPSSAAAGPAGRPLSFLQAALFQWINPKAWIIAIGAIAAYTTAEGPAMTTQALALAGIFLVVAIPCTAAWTLSGVGAARLLPGARGLRAFNLAMAALLVASLLPMLREF